jgi:glycosyltransferase involved in cell wall biosynthesis
MQPDFQVSIIVPVYNAEAFLNIAIESAVHNNDVGEIILIEDRSPDNCLAICKELEKKYSKIKLLQHPNGENRGAGASRNLGIQNASMPYIAFLDADDYYLPHRFEESKKIFEENSSIDYTFGTAQYDKEFDAKSNNYKQMKISGPAQANIFQNFLFGNCGYFHANAITIKSKSLKGMKLFNPLLKLHQDSELWLRITYNLKGASEPPDNTIAVVRQHANNRITHKNKQSLLLYWNTIKQEFADKQLTDKQKKVIDLNIQLLNSNMHPFLKKIYGRIMRLRLK